MSIHDLVRQARRAKGMTQSALARAVNCQQSAISMYEAGRSDALSDEKVQAVAEVLGVDLPEAVPGPQLQADPARGVLKYCPLPDCPANIPYTAGGRVCFKPTMIEAPAGEPTRCPLCAEVLEDCCPGTECGAPVTEGSFCMKCGTAYVSAVLEGKGWPEQWVAERRAEIREVRRLSDVRRM
ncbi:MAG: hypothetical protein A3K19_16060 [Lentisphaerae bacterium RIFOXYB12_FULL_65_16]|nr:MAG: hypothetical protein A3K18_12965 [Lentisphaerae bacterium RIFOXYA12_64_32]OGV87340.1 MAG: hypothetical protein A3K19_16060 [Lentisphaerae bacterium RIFOXYB12_FULL_65_16]